MTVNVALIVRVEALEAENKALKSTSVKLIRTSESKALTIMILSSAFILALLAMRFYYASLSF